MIKYIASLGPVGFSPVAPGTAGTVLACLFVIALRPDPRVLLVLSLLLAVTGTVVSERAERVFGRKDSPHIVIDEFVGYLVAVLWIPINAEGMILSFLIFRIFDILKPPPIRFLEKRLHGGLGVMVDDILAGIYTNLIVRLILSLH